MDFRIQPQYFAQLPQCCSGVIRSTLSWNFINYNGSSLNLHFPKLTLQLSPGEPLLFQSIGRVLVSTKCVPGSSKIIAGFLQICATGVTSRPVSVSVINRILADQCNLGTVLSAELSKMVVAHMENDAATVTPLPKFKWSLGTALLVIPLTRLPNGRASMTPSL